MVYSFELIKHANIRYRDSLVVLSRCELFAMLFALGINSGISVESLGMKSMASKKSGNGKATLDNGYGMFLSMLEYKQREKGHYLIKVDKWYPSSQLCHVCGHKEPSVKDLHIRHWVCPCCGSLHDRDVNASINIDNEGLRQFLAG